MGWVRSCRCWLCLLCCWLLAAGCCLQLLLIAAWFLFSCRLALTARTAVVSFPVANNTNASYAASTALLLAHGADWAARDEDGRTAREVLEVSMREHGDRSGGKGNNAAARGRAEVARLLRQAEEA